MEGMNVLARTITRYPFLVSNKVAFLFARMIFSKLLMHASVQTVDDGTSF